jgi:hypothetical protein
MKKLRRLHLLLGCVFAPLLLYYCLSGAWQLLDLHRQKKIDNKPIYAAFEQLSNPHLGKSMPGAGPKANHSQF